MPTPPAVLRGSLGPILLLIQVRLLSVMGLPVERVRIEDPADVGFDSQADQVAFIWEESGTPETGIILGAGRIDARFTDLVSVTLRTRCGLDEPSSHQAWMCDSELGHDVWRVAVFDSLVTFWPEDGLGNALTTQPLYPVSRRGAKIDKQQREWGESKMVYACVYEAGMPSGLVI